MSAQQPMDALLSLPPVLDPARPLQAPVARSTGADVQLPLMSPEPDWSLPPAEEVGAERVVLVPVATPVPPTPNPDPETLWTGVGLGLGLALAAQAVKSWSS